MTAPPVYVVDSHATAPPLPPRAARGRGRTGGLAQSLLFVLVSVALGGVILEAVLIFYLHPSRPERASASFSELTAEKLERPPSPSPEVPLSKPAAHLMDGPDAVHDKAILGWSTIADPLLHQMDYKDRSLVIRKDGHYFVYSKVFFVDVGVFHHTMHTLRDEESIPLLQSRTYSTKTEKKSNSFLGGVFHLHKGDALFVKVSNSSKVARHKTYENVFGAFMI
ncbi:tumor necrosis factor ligand superfamily member 14 isoform X1 [Dunckerocampus dactyliophorus]|uniref:tumor necrosis factor ligand superfamily member 14 isoform X1 n=1 Tax=Dunckerocampus dactyliophorus TaxID=161453 RepID=UPI0024058493|nr:tumor necrosis factor ligand superfamily member 14 isoform X1 [Dunckerocampus dactyliophorus]